MKSKLSDIWLYWVLALVSLGAEAQTGKVPLASGDPPSGLTNSNISITNGNVGISAPGATSKLTINGSGNQNIDLMVNGRISTGDNGNNGGVWVNQENGQFFGTAGSSLMGLFNTNWGLVMNSSGNVGVGIGPTNPLSRLHVDVGSGSTPNIAELVYGSTSAGTFIGPAGNSVKSATMLIGSGWNEVNSSGAGLLNIFNSSGSVLWVENSGRVGIGVPDPHQKLEVNGFIQTDAGIYFPGYATPQTIPYTGIPCGGDYAESVDVTGDRTKYEPGDVLVIDPEVSGRFLKSSTPYSTAVTGIYSTKPGTLGRRQTTPQRSEEVPMAMLGIVPTKVSTENGVIHRGDLLVTSSTPGYAMKGTDRSLLTGAVIGKALDNFEQQKGVIEVVVTLQ